MDDKQRIQLQNMIKTNNTVDYTESIRELKHSHLIREQCEKLMMLKNQFNGDDEKIHYEAINECNFLYTYYTDIYNKLRKDELDLTILKRLLDVLEKIEQGDLDQHEASFEVGTILKQLYVDSALKKADKINQQEENKVTKEQKATRNITWKQFKKTI
jgi:hypothetical protein